MVWVLGQSQKTYTKTWKEPNIETVEIVAPWATQIEVKSISQSATITVAYKAGGEYQNQVSLSSSFSGKTLVLTEKKIPNFKQYNDKLSAHKSIATQLHITLPETMTIRLIANDANVEFVGTKTAIDVQLNNGIFQLFGTLVSGTIKTLRAAVIIFDQKLVVDASSKTGRVNVNPKTRGEKPQLKIQSVSGNIFQK